MSENVPIRAQTNKSGARRNWVRAAVLGANDGIVSIAGLVVGVASASGSKPIIFTAGMAGLVAGALSMAAGEYVSVSSQRDTEKALLKKEEYALHNNPEEELLELVDFYEAKGLSGKTALLAAKELTAHDAFAAHVEVELGIDPNDLTNPWHAAWASAGAFLAGATLPLVAILSSPESVRIPVTFVSVLLALALTGALSAKVGGAPITRAALRVMVGGALAMLITIAIGNIFSLRV